MFATFRNLTIGFVAGEPGPSEDRGQSKRGPQTFSWARRFSLSTSGPHLEDRECWEHQETNNTIKGPFLSLMLLRLRSACHSLPSPTLLKDVVIFLFPTSSLCPFYWTIPISINAAISSMCLRSFSYFPFQQWLLCHFTSPSLTKVLLKVFFYCCL